MQTIVGISLSPVYILPLMFTFSIIGRTLLFRVRYFLSDTGHLWYKTHPAVLSGIWLYSIAVALIILSSSPLLYRIHAVLILSFILQMAVTDALTGLLPGTFTRRFLIAGMLSQITTDICSANIALIQYEDGEKRYILAPVNLKAGLNEKQLVARSMIRK